MNQADIVEDLVKISEVLFDLQKLEAKAVEEGRGCSIYSDCDVHSHKFCCKSYFYKFGERPNLKEPITSPKRYHLCRTYQKYVLEKLKERADKEKTDWSYTVSTLISFYPEPCQFQSKCSKYDQNEDKCKNNLTAPKRLMDCREPYANFIYRIISEGMRKTNILEKKLRLSQELVDSVRFIGPDDKRYPITYWFIFIKYRNLLVPYEKEGLEIIELGPETIKELSKESGELARKLSEKIGTTSRSHIEETFKEKMFELIKSKKN